MSILVTNFDDKTCHRLMMQHQFTKALEYAKKFGAYKASKIYKHSPNTYKKWLRRFADPQYCIRHIMYPNREYRPPSNKTPQHTRDAIIKLRKESGFGPKRIISHLGLQISSRTASRILRETGLARDWGYHHGKSPANPRYVGMLSRIILEINRRAWSQMQDSDLSYTQRERIVKKRTKAIEKLKKDALRP